MPLKISSQSSSLRDVAADLLVIGVGQGFDEKAGALAELNDAMGGQLMPLLTREDFTGKKDQVLSFAALGHLKAARVALVGLGDLDKMRPEAWRTFAARAAREGNGSKAKSLAVHVPGVLGPARAETIGQGIVFGAYRFTKYLTGDRKPKATLDKVTVLAEGMARAQLNKSLEQGRQLAECVTIARDLVNEPPNELGPLELAACAERVAREHGLACSVFDKKELTRRGMKLILAVGQGSAKEPRLVHLAYKPKRAAEKRLVLVGKGLTFDSGGLCIKPAQGMGEMKSDMAGAANVVAFMAAVAVVKPDFEVHGIIGCAENMPDGNAYRPGDVFGSLDGKTVEIVNTDAEGRLVLADALAYGASLDPTVMVCNATLTGACVVALGQRCSGFFATTDDLATTFKESAQEAGEQFWHMPLLDDLKDLLKSDVADLKHTGDRWGGSITAALFLREFVGKAPFIHCDIAGPALADKAYGFYTKGGTGHGVLTFLEFMRRI